MTEPASQLKRRRRFRLVSLTCVLALSTLAMGTVVWRRLEQTRIATWVTAMNKLGVDTEVTDDRWDPTLLGRARTCLNIPTTQVYVWGARGQAPAWRAFR